MSCGGFDLKTLSDRNEADREVPRLTVFAPLGFARDKRDGDSERIAEIGNVKTEICGTSKDLAIRASAERLFAAA